MNIDIGLRQDTEGVLWLDKAPQPPRRVVTVATACQRLRRTRRQIYRLMQAGRLGPIEKLLGEWLLDQAAVKRLARTPLSAAAAARTPEAAVLPEYEPKVLNASKDIISRVLEGGGREDVKWLLKRNSRQGIRRVIEEEGSRLLSPQSRRLWSLVFKATPRPLAAWRHADPWRAAQS